MRTLCLAILFSGLASLAVAAPPEGKGSDPHTTSGPQGQGPAGNGPPGHDVGAPSGHGPDGNGPPGPGPGGPGARSSPGSGPGAGSGNAGLANPSAEVLSPEGQVTIGADQNVARDAVASGNALPLSEISRRIEAALQARVIDARLLRARGRLVYQLTTVADDGVTQKLYVDARTGLPLGKK
jgi:hypothetical protein